MNLNFDAQSFFAGLVAFVVAVTIHEFMHAFTAYQLGDATAARLGRVTLNPVMHFDPLGFFMLIFLLLGGIGLAWGRPVPVNPGNFRNPKRGMLLVAAAGRSRTWCRRRSSPSRFGLRRTSCGDGRSSRATC